MKLLTWIKQKAREKKKNNFVENNLIKAAKDIILPPVCPICGNINTKLICSDCKSKIKKLIDVCDFCGAPKNSEKCLYCRDKNFYFYRLRSYCVYGGAIKKILYKYKQQKNYNLKKVLAGFLEELYIKNFSSGNISYIEGIPGNHIEYICSELETKLNIPYSNNLKKIRATKKQKELDFSARSFNLEDSFKLKDCLKVHGKNVLLIDDIFTTGSTLNQASKVLKDAGANKIFALTVARSFKQI